jgi:hypothetical protein
MVIDDLNLEGIASLPTKYNPPLIIYADRVVPVNSTRPSVKVYCSVIEYGDVSQPTSRRPGVT